MTLKERKTRETSVRVELELKPGPLDIGTGFRLLDHFLETLARHGEIGLTLSASGDGTEDNHHLVEDVAITLGEALGEALGDRSVARFGWAIVPMDESLVRCAVDLVDRPYFSSNMSDPLFLHFMRSFCFRVPMTLHLDVLKPGERHHETEACFKALGISLREAKRPAKEFPTVK